MRRVGAFRVIAISSLMFAASSLAAQGGGAVAPANTPIYKLLRSASGSESTKSAGGFHINDPRSTFYLPADKKVIVYMEWEGPSGKHTFEAYWRNPEGRVTVVSDFKYEQSPQEKRYAGYMQLNLVPEMQSGMWSMEARIDGELLGKHAFEIVSAAKPAMAEDTRIRLSVAEQYNKASASSRLLEALDAQGRTLRYGMGFFIAKNQFLTAFQNIDGADAVRIRLGNGQALLVHVVVAYDRWQDWAILPAENGTSMTRSPAPGSIGERETTLSIDQNGNSSIVDASWIGKINTPHGDRFKMASSVLPQSAGSPVMNEYGEVVGLTAGLPIPGLRSLVARDPNMHVVMYPGNLYESGLMVNAVDTSIPIEQVPTNAAGGATFSELATSGVFTPIFTTRVRVGQGTLCKRIEKGDIPRPAQESYTFARTEMMQVYVMWYPEKKDKAMAAVKIYDLNNKLVTESPAKNVKFAPGDTTPSIWSVPLTNLVPAIYRVDITLDGVTDFRTYFRVQ